MKRGWIVAGLAAALAGCASAGREARPVATARVDLPRSYRYAPADITVPAGATVTWKNSDGFTHSVRFRDPVDTNLVMKPGDSVSFRFARPGHFAYDCAFHGQMMKGSVEVTAP